MQEEAASNAETNGVRKQPEPKPTDERYTPAWLKKLVVDFFGRPVCLDPASPLHNPMGADVYCVHPNEDAECDNPDSVLMCDGLATDWWHQMNDGRPLSPSSFPGAWLNPPYSAGQLEVWAAKVIEEAVKGCEILVLTQNDSSTQWYRSMRENCDVRCNLGRRVIFDTPAGKGKGGAKFASTIFYFGQHRRRFARVFGEQTGWEIIHGLGPLEQGLPTVEAAAPPDAAKALRDLASTLGVKL